MVALKVAAVVPAATVTKAGTVRVGLLLDRLTLAPPVGAGLVRVTVQVLEALGPRLVGEQNSEETRTGATRDTLAEVEFPLREAVSSAVWSEDSVPAVAVKVAVKEPVGIVTLAGTMSAGKLELSPITTGLVAAALRLTVQVLVPPEDNEPGVHAREVKDATTKMLPPVPDTGMGYPATDAPKVSLTPMENEPAPGASVTVTTATFPSRIVFVFSPLVRQMYALAPPEQLIVLPADINTGPGVTEKLVTLAAG